MCHTNKVQGKMSLIKKKSLNSLIKDQNAAFSSTQKRQPRKTPLFLVSKLRGDSNLSRGRQRAKSTNEKKKKRQNSKQPRKFLKKWQRKLQNPRNLALLQLHLPLPRPPKESLRSDHFYLLYLSHIYVLFYASTHLSHFMFLPRLHHCFVFTCSLFGS